MSNYNQSLIEDYRQTIKRLQKECTEKTNAIIALGEHLKAKEQELNDYKKQFKADTKEMEDCQNEIVRHLESLEYLRTKLRTKEQECGELKERIKCNCFDPKSNNNRCISYNRIAEDYERDLKRLENKIAECEKYEQALDEIEKEVHSLGSLIIIQDIINKAKDGE